MPTPTPTLSTPHALNPNASLPVARAASAYDYLTNRWKHKTGACTPPPYSVFCRDPFVLGKMANLFGCCGSGGPEHDYYHVEPISRCITTAQGELAVDFVVR